MPLSTCSVCRTPTQYGKSRCSRHPIRYAPKPSSYARGYDAEYVRNRKIILSDDPICCICNSRLATTADHIVPLSRGGDNGIYNLRPACFRCNSGRGNRPI
ncbi:HNH endonuclease [Actinoplanes sp. CA-054009]